MMKRLSLLAVSVLFAAQAFANYVVVLKDGTRYRAKEKWHIVNGKAFVNLENGSTIQLDPALIDVQKSDEVTAYGLGDVKVLAVEDRSAATPQKQKQSLGSMTHLRKPPVDQAQDKSTTAPDKKGQASGAVPPIPTSTSGMRLGDEVVRKFAAAYENIGIFEQKITAIGPDSLRIELTADNEEKVFNAISATSFLMVHNVGIQGVNIAMVELFMKTTTGGAAGRFQMDRTDAEALDKKTVSHKDYFIRKVIY